MCSRMFAKITMNYKMLFPVAVTPDSGYIMLLMLKTSFI